MRTRIVLPLGRAFVGFYSRVVRGRFVSASKDVYYGKHIIVRSSYRPRSYRRSLGWVARDTTSLSQCDTIITVFCVPHPPKRERRRRQ